MRNPIACVSCRTAKQKCLHNDAPPCERCKQTGRAELCAFPQPGTSFIHRKPKRPRLLSEDTTAATATPSPAAPQLQPATLHHRRPGDEHLPNGSGSALHAASHPQTSPTAASSPLEGVDPFELLTDEVKNSYLRCSYKWSFHHTPTLLLRIRDRTLETWMVWAILALAIRYATDPGRPSSCWR